MAIITDMQGGNPLLFLEFYIFLLERKRHSAEIKIVGKYTKQCISARWMLMALKPASVPLADGS